MKIIFKTLLLFIALTLAAFLLAKELYVYAAISFTAAIWITGSLYRTTVRLQKEMALFAETIYYHDFSGKFSESHVPSEISKVRSHFNRIIGTIKQLNRDKEIHYQYLQKVLEVIDTGIISYNLQSGEVLWMNDAVKEMLRIPYLKTIRSLEKRNRTLFHSLEMVKSGTPAIITLSKGGIISKILVSVSSFHVDNQPFQLIAMQNVSDALNENEVKAWQKLLRVLTHEIMNSVTPISSLSNTLKSRLSEQIRPDMIDSEALADIRTGIETIERRSEGLIRFAQTYRNLSKIGEPKWDTVKVSTLFEHIRQLLTPTLIQKEIQLHINLPDSTLTLQADSNLIEQVLVNLIVNAMEAVKRIKERRITLSAQQEHNKKIKMVISDNGHGIPPEMMEHIFMPFFSSRPGGSGIGLNLCRQIMLMHKGAIHVKSEVGRGTSFVLQF